MRLTWRDLATIPFMVVITATYAAHLRGAEGWLFSSARGTALTILVLGLGGGCALGNAIDVLVGQRRRRFRPYSALAGTLGFIALASGGVAMIAGNEVALAVLFGTTMALWLLAMARHAITRPPASRSGDEAREILSWLHTRR